MLIRILLVILSLLLLSIGYYLFSHRNKNFMVFKPETNTLLSSLLLAFGLAIIIEGVIGLIATFILIPIFWGILVVIFCLTVGALTTILSFFMN